MIRDTADSISVTAAWRRNISPFSRRLFLSLKNGVFAFHGVAGLGPSIPNRRRESSSIYPFSNTFDSSTQSFFGFGQSADIEITLDGAETRKTADIKSEDGKKERHLLYYDGETVSGKVGFSETRAPWSSG